MTEKPRHLMALPSPDEAFRIGLGLFIDKLNAERTILGVWLYNPETDWIYRRESVTPDEWDEHLLEAYASVHIVTLQEAAHANGMTTRPGVMSTLRSAASQGRLLATRVAGEHQILAAGGVWACSCDTWASSFDDDGPTHDLCQHIAIVTLAALADNPASAVANNISTEVDEALREKRDAWIRGVEARDGVDRALEER